MPLPEVAVGQSGEIADTNKAYDLIDSLNVNVTDPDFAGGAKGDDISDDYAAMNAAILATPAGGICYWPGVSPTTGLPAKYVSSNTLPLRDDITYLMGHDTRWTAYTGTPCYIKPKFGAFLGTALFAGTDIDGFTMRNMSLHSGRATGPAGAAVHGISVTGSVKGVRLQNVWINNFAGYGVLTDTNSNGFPGGWEVSNLDIENCRDGGWRSNNSGSVSFAFGDGSILQSEATANGGDGWYFAGVNAFDFINVRSVFNSGAANGFVIDGPCGLLGFTACQTDRNIRNGILLHSVDSAPTAQPAPHGITVTACNFSRDGKNDDSTQGGYAGIRIQGDSSSVRHCPVTISGCTVHVTKGDAGTGLLSPDYGIYITNGRRVVVSANILVATVATIFDDLGALLHGVNSHNLVNVSSGAVTNNVAGYGLQVVEGTNAKMGTATLVAGTVTVSTTAVTASSRIFLDNQSLGGTAGFLRVSARTAGTSFTITSSSGTDTSTVAWMLVEPA